MLPEQGLDLHGVGGHHLPAQPQGQLHRQGGLAGGRGAAYDENIGFHGHTTSIFAGILGVVQENSTQ